MEQMPIVEEPAARPSEAEQSSQDKKERIQTLSIHNDPLKQPKTLFLFGLDPTTKAKDLGQEFEKYGKLVRCDIPMPKSFQTPQKLFAFVEYEETEEAQAALDKMNGQEFQGHMLQIEFAKDRSEERSRPRRFRSARPAPYLHRDDYRRSRDDPYYSPGRDYNRYSNRERGPPPPYYNSDRRDNYSPPRHRDYAYSDKRQFPHDREPSRYNRPSYDRHDRSQGERRSSALPRDDYSRRPKEPLSRSVSPSK